VTQPETPPAPASTAPAAASAVPAIPSQPAFPQTYGQAPYGYAPQVPAAKIRGTGVCILLTIVTFGIYPVVWYYKVHEEMKQHTGSGIGGVVALLLGLFVGIVMPYLSSSEVGQMYERRGMPKPVSGLTGLWYFPGMFLLGIGPIVWFVKTNGALNAYWRAQGVR